MTGSDSNPIRLLSTALVGAGVVAIVGPLVQEAIGIGQPGLGQTQKVIIAAGAVMLVAGFGLSADKRRVLFERLAALWTQSPRLGIGQCLVLAAWFGLAVGYIELVHQAIRKYAFDILLKQTVDIVWMGPLSYLVMALVLGLVGAVLMRMRILPFAIVVFAMVALASWSQFRIHRWLDSVAVALVSLGIGAQVARFSTTHVDTLLAVSRRTVPWLLGLLILTGGAVPSLGWWSEQRRLAELPDARPDAPNVLLIVFDTVRADHFDLYGYDRPTAPRIRQLADRGVLFEQPIAPCSWTLPTHASIFTGRFGSEHGASWKIALDDTYPTVAEAMSASGYVAGGFVGNLVYCAKEYGIARGFTHYEDFYVTFPVIAWSTSAGEWLAFRTLGRQFTRWVRNDAETISSQFIRWVDGIEDGRPFFGFVNYFDAHSLVLPPEPHLSKFAPPGDFLDKWFHSEKWTDEEYQVFRNAYDGAIHYMDAEIGKILDHLEKRGVLDNTIVIVTSDHGEQFGEHGLKDHGNSLYMNSIHVPLVVSFPGRVPAGTRVGPPVSLCDLPATIFDLAGVRPAQEFPGRSLAPLWESDSSIDMDAFTPPDSELAQSIQMPQHWKNFGGNMASVIVDGMHYIRNGDGTEELYDLGVDPLELKDLHALPKYQELVERARKRR